MSGNKRLTIAFIGMSVLTVAFAFAPMFIQVSVWLFLWLNGYVGDAPVSTPDLAWLEWLSYLLPLVVYLIILTGVVKWVRRSPII